MSKQTIYGGVKMMDVLVDFDNFESIPQEVVKYIIGNKNDFIREDCHHYVDRYSSIASLDERLINIHIQTLKSMLNSVKIKAGHYTRVIDSNDIKINGLKKLNLSEHYERIVTAVNGHFDIDDYEMENFKKHIESIDKEMKGIRENLVSCFYPVSNGIDCEHYTNAVGGEVIEFGQARFPNIYNCLCQVGEPVRVIVAIPYKIIGEHFQETLIDSLIGVTLVKNINKSDDISWLNREIKVSENISPDNIMEIQKL